MNNKSMVRPRPLGVTAGKHPSSNPILHGNAAYQSGAVLIISLIMLLLLTLIGTTGMQSTSLEEKMAGNMRDRHLAFQAAESALKAAEAILFPIPPAVLPTFTGPDADAGIGGIYSVTPTTPITDASLLDSFWTDTTRPKATSTVTGLGNGIATPLYIIQDMGITCTTTTLPCPPSDQKQTYRVTARATGGTTNAVVILQSIYSRP